MVVIQRRQRVLGWLLVAVQVLLLIALVVLPWRVAPSEIRSSDPWTWIGVVLVIAGLVVAVLAMRTLGAALTATPVPSARATLVTYGIYSRVRHPIYSGLLLAAGGFAVAIGSWWQLGSWVALLLFFLGKSRWEDAMLAKRYPGQWPSYARRTGALIPKLG